MIQVVAGDLASLEADAVLRPADELLRALTPGGSGLDLRAGSRFAEECRVSSPLEAGAAVVTGGGELAAPFVLHVVIRDPRTPVGAEAVRRALVSAWQRASDWGLATIAAPLVGAGAGQLSPEDSATLLAETFTAGRGAGCPRELRIVVDEDAERELVETVLRRMA